eukprot:TRINITY_DN26881_c0_g1_i1.p2 TRINITY_DN26881_c0_g1~~TRINITY_DN26881_c0_g1_i1.p2  ORF type:complete len:133 (-),score=24.73 TRINITY_DN26881_c0_g1_i1:498-896(-)
MQKSGMKNSFEDAKSASNSRPSSPMKILTPASGSRPASPASSAIVMIAERPVVAPQTPTQRSHQLSTSPPSPSLSPELRFRIPVGAEREERRRSSPEVDFSAFYERKIILPSAAVRDLISDFLDDSPFFSRA